MYCNVMRESVVLQNDNILDVELNTAAILGDMNFWGLCVNTFSMSVVEFSISLSFIATYHLIVRLSERIFTVFMCICLKPLIV